MKVNGSFGQQLLLKETVLRPGSEWAPRLPGWSFIHLTEGLGYWLHPRLNRELATGTVMVLSEQTQGLLRASQLGDLVAHYFCIRPERLSGLVTLAEQRTLENAGRREACSSRFFTAAEPVANAFRSLCERRNESPLRQRFQMLELFIQAFENELQGQAADEVPDDGARARLEMLLKEMHASDMMQLSFPDLAAQVGCCPRHLGRVFQEVVGTSFREKQAQLRLGRAQELLLTTKSKVVEVALESGYQSLSLFNLMFKRRFGVTPAQWRQRPGKVKMRM
jgi:AraC-like DNA-binding protein